MIKIALPPLPEPKWVMERLEYNKMSLSVPPTTLTRSEAFKLIGQLEKLAGSL